MDRLVKVFQEYEERLRSSDYVPRFSYGRRMVRDEGDPNRYFLLIMYDIVRREPEPFWSFERLGRGHISVSSFSLPFISGQAVDSG